jgi:single-stranded DNA-binding protein
MADKNVVIVEGRLTMDPVYIEKEGRVPLCLLRIACNRLRQNRDTGVWEDHPRFFSVTVRSSRANEVAITFGKGEKVLVKGYLDWYEKGEGAEHREFVTIVTRVPKSEEQPRAGTGSDDESVS